jgi:hypothetical protein
MKSGCHSGAVADVPLTGRDDLERLVALLEELHRVGDLLRLTDQVARGCEEVDDGLLGAEDGLPGELRVRLETGFGGDRLRGLGDDAAVEAEDRAVGEVEFAPPHDVGDVAEGAHHRDAGALVGLGEVVGEHGHLDPEHGRGHGRAEQRLEALVVGVGDEGDAGGEELRPCGLDLDGAAVWAVEGESTVGARLLLVLELRLGDRRAEGDVPEGRRHGLVGLAAVQVAQERELARRDRLVADGAVALRPVHGEAERTPDGLELLLVLDGEALAQLDEVATRDRDLVGGLGALVVATLERRGEVGVVGERRVAPDAVVVLDAAFGRETVVVPAHGVEDALAGHPLVAGDDVGVRVAEDVTDVQGSGCGRRRGVDRVDALTRRAVALEPVGPRGLPGGAPLLLETFEGRLVRDAGSGHEAISC